MAMTVDTITIRREDNIIKADLTLVINEITPEAEAIIMDKKICLNTDSNLKQVTYTMVALN